MTLVLGVIVVGNDNNPTLVMVTQQLDSEYWSNTDPAFVDLLTSANTLNASVGPDDPARVPAMHAAAAAIGCYLADKLEAAGASISSSHAILHDRDRQKIWDQVKNDYVLQSKALHIHMIIKFKDRKSSLSLLKMGDALGLHPQYIDKGKPGGRGVEIAGQKVSQSHDNQLGYLIHAKDPEKHQYQPEQVADIRVNGSFTYAQACAERIDAWRKGRAVKVTKKAVDEASVEDLRYKILDGSITRNQIMLTDEYFEVYSRNQVMFDQAFSAYGQRRAYRAAAKLQAGDFSTTVVFIHGPAGSGKTQLAKSFVDDAITRSHAAGENWEFYRAATGNPMDDWNGEEIVFLDDARSSTMDANDWLLLLDPYNASPAKARYRNKTAVAPRLIIITNPIDPVRFFFYARQKGDVDEAIDQFLRRLSAVVKSVSVDEFYSSKLEKGRDHRMHVTAEDEVTISYKWTDSMRLNQQATSARLMEVFAGMSPDVKLLEQ